MRPRPLQLHERPDHELVQTDMHPPQAELRPLLDIAEDGAQAQALEDTAHGRGVADRGLVFGPDLEPPRGLGLALEGQGRPAAGRAQAQGAAARGQHPLAEVVEPVVFAVALPDQHGAHFQEPAPDQAEVRGPELDFGFQH